MRLSWKVLLGLSLALVLARAVLVLSLADVFFYGEELAKGAAAKAMLDRLPVEHWRLAYHAYEGGGFVTSHLDALLFGLIGPSLLAHKLIALGFAVALLWLGVRFCERWFGRTAALVFAGLCILAAGSFQKLSLLNLGIHYQALVFDVAILHLALRFVEEPGPRARTGFLLGLAAGFGTYFNYQCALAALAALGLIAVARPRALATRATASALAGTLLGLAPLAWMFANAGAAVFDIHGESLAPVDDEPQIARLELARSFARSLVAGRGALELAALAALPLAACAGLAAALWRGAAERRAGLAVALFLALFLVAYWTSDFAVGEIYHYFRLNRLCPAWLGLVLLASAGLGLALEARARPWRFAGGLGLGVLLAAGVQDLARAARGGAGLAPREHLALLARTKGYDYRDYLQKLARHLEGDPEQRLRALLGFRESAPKLLLPPAAEAVFLDNRRPLENLAVTCSLVEPVRWPMLVIGFGGLVKRRHPGAFAARVEALRAYPPALHAPLAEAIGRFGSGFIVSEDRVRAEIESLRGAELPREFWVGLGWRLSGALGDRSPGAPRYFESSVAPLWAAPERAEQFVQGLPERERGWVLEGFQEARAARRI